MDKSIGDAIMGTSTTLATTTTLAGTIVSTLFSGLLNLLALILPYAVGVLIFWIGYRFARRALGGN